VLVECVADLLCVVVCCKICCVVVLLKYTHKALHMRESVRGCL